MHSTRARTVLIRSKLSQGLSQGITHTLPATSQRVATPVPPLAAASLSPTRKSTRRKKRIARYANTTTCSFYALNAADLSSHGSVLTR